MALREKNFLKTLFETGDIPTEFDFGDFIDSFVNILQDIYDGVDSTDTQKALSANVGKVLYDNIEAHKANSSNPHSLTPGTIGAAPASHFHLEADVTDLLHNAVQIQGVPVNAAAPSTGDTLIFGGAEYAPGTTSKVKSDAADPTADYLDAKVDNVNLDVNTSTHVIRIKPGSDLEDAVNNQHEHVFNDSLSGDRDGINMVYTTTSNYVSGSTQIYLNGIRMLLGTDYTETDVNEITFSDYAPVADDSLLIDYLI